MIYEEHGLTTEIAFNSALKKAGIEITSYVAPFEITTDTICIVDTTKHDAEIRNKTIDECINAIDDEYYDGGYGTYHDVEMVVRMLKNLKEQK